ncbi:helicase-related protein [Peribacillus asahii]|uniref:DEAD/DEAH box helicase n=1 Tax=Peribacillus asahii TaxID=228899 RepID=UPI00207A39D7|nr:helicase-related protein [Peribacillus asahii]USK68578.1 DEAD/DEAH box helicase [Peribacillus asahii]
MLQSGDIVKGPLWPEVVEIKTVQILQTGVYQVEARGLDTNTYSPVIILERQLSSIIKLNENNGGKALTADQLQAYLWYEELAIDKKFSKSRALGNKQVIPLPHQIEAVYGRMLQTPTVRYLLADDPGAGKTIMAGMLIRELKARQSAERILIVVPPLVLKQWQEELHEKFQEEFVILTRASVHEQSGKNPFAEHSCILASMYWTAREDVKSLLMEVDFDLVIVDEAHKMAAYTTHGKQKTTRRTKLYKLGESLLRHTQHCLLLTATPHKGDVENFRHLMKLVDADIFSSIGIKETMRDKANPFIIRRLKEKLKNFDGSPLFPKRTTHTIQYHLSQQELHLYKQVTEYVKNHFNRALIRQKHGTAFAMMLLQRRLSSSTEAIHCSLQRRFDRLTEVLEKELEQDEINSDEYDEISYEEQEQLEHLSEGSVDTIDLHELQVELVELEKLIGLTSELRMYHTERKFEELEKTLFGKNGLLAKGEKILIFTESTDTLLYLENRLTRYGLKIAKIIGRFSMDERRRQVEYFGNDHQIMLATDAGGESINLQFCNQMINYDIPWNPNKLEQRMGRIHRIGQKNEVFIFNLVAKNTREGDVLLTLLTKMESMRKDLGSDLVYDFIGDRLEDQYTNLPSLMQNAILNRETLEEIKGKVNQAISEEYKELLKVTEQDRIGMESVDLYKMQREQVQIAIHRVPTRIYSRFAYTVLGEHRVRINELQEGDVYRVERIPRSLRDFARTNKISLKSKDEGYRFTGKEEWVEEQQPLMENNHPLYELSLLKQRERIINTLLSPYMITTSVPEKLKVESYEICLTDGTGRELFQDIVYLAERDNGERIELDSYWLFAKQFENVSISPSVQNSAFMMSALEQSMKKREKLALMLEGQLNKKLQFLRRAFNSQYEDTLERLEKYKRENEANRNSALINQMQSQLFDIEERRKLRIEELERERNINILPPRLLSHFLLQPSLQNSYRVINDDYREVVKNFEQQNNRKVIETCPSLGLVDFISEDREGRMRFIILISNSLAQLTNEHFLDLGELKKDVWLYTVQEDGVLQIRPLI